MNSLAVVAEKVKGFAKSSQDFLGGLVLGGNDEARHNPIEILKRLQREAFSDLMKLRDRQDKVERMLSFYKTSKGGPFLEDSTHIRGEIDALGAILMMGDIDQRHYDALGKAGIRTGIHSRFNFETTVRQKDTLIAEFMASQKGMGDVSGSPLSLTKVLYIANVTDWFSAIAIPLGAQSRDIGITRDDSQPGKGLTDFSSFGPPLLNQYNGSAIGLTVRKSNVAASLAQSVSGLEIPGRDEIGHCFSTFGQVVCQLPRGISLSLLGLLQVPKSSRQCLKFGAFAIPVGTFRPHKARDMFIEASDSPLGRNTWESDSSGSIALKLESELDENPRIRGWVEMQNSNLKSLRWGITMLDDYEDEFGWSVSFGGMLKNPKFWDHLQVESFVKLNLGRKFNLKPGIAYVADGNARMLALMLRSSWSF